jgi:hypothetical protein
MQHFTYLAKTKTAASGVRETVTNYKKGEQSVMHQFRYSVKTKADRNRAWEIFTNHENWRSFANIYGEMKWIKGYPWQVGSTLEIEVLRPIEVIVDHTIVLCNPGRMIGWIDRALGITVSQWVSFEEQPDGGTRVHTQGEVFAHGLKIAGKSVDGLVETFTETWYENFRAACDQPVDDACDCMR